MKGGKNMRKKLIVAMMAGVLSAGMFSTGVFAADTDLKGEVNIHSDKLKQCNGRNPERFQ